MDPTVIILGLVALVLLGTERYYNHREAKSLPPNKYDPHYTRKIEKEVLGQVYTVCDNLKCKECRPGLIELPRTINYCMSPTCSNVTSDKFCQRCRMRGIDKKTSSNLKPKRGEIIFNAKLLRYECNTCNLKFTDESAGKHKTCPDCTATDCISCGVKLPKGIHRSTCRQCNMLDPKYRNDPRYKGYTQKDIEFQKWVREFAAHKVKLNALREDIETQLRRVEVDGYTCIRPSEVPDNAHAEIIRRGSGDANWNGVFICFKWTDQKSGKQMFLKTLAQPRNQSLDLIEPKFDYVRK